MSYKVDKEEREALVEEALQVNDFLLDLDKLIPQKHHWVDRGVVMSCEGGTHPPHRAFKRR